MLGKGEFMGPFRDRSDAGRYLARKLEKYAGEKPVILALPRGGLPVAAEIAKRLHAELDVLGVKKIGAPQYPELAMGAVAEGGEIMLDEEMAARFDPDRRHTRQEAERKTSELNQLLARFRAIKPPVPLAGRTVIVVDDGLATGATMEAAVRVITARGAQRVVVAVPVASLEAFGKLSRIVDEVVAIVVPGEFYAVGVWYEEFDQVSETEAVQILGRGISPAA